PPALARPAASPAPPAPQLRCAPAPPASGSPAHCFDSSVSDGKPHRVRRRIGLVTAAESSTAIEWRRTARIVSDRETSRCKRKHSPSRQVNHPVKQQQLSVSGFACYLPYSRSSRLRLRS